MRASIFKPLCLLLLCLLVWSCVQTAHGQENAQPDYQAALSRSLAAHEAGDYRAARAAMEEAHALAPSARTLRGLGIIAYAEGRYLEAVLPLEQSLTSSVRPLTPALRTAVNELLERVWTQIARVRLSLDAPDGVVEVDGAPPVWRGPHELLLTPGRHRLAVTAKGRTPHVLSLQLAAGEVQTLHIALAPAPAPSAAVTPATPAAAPDTHVTRPDTSSPQPLRTAVASTRELSRPRATSGWRSPGLRNALWAGTGVSVVSAAALWLAAWRHFDEVRAHCRARASGGCSAEQARVQFDEANVAPLARSAMVVTVLGGVTLASALGLTLWQRHARTEVRLTPAGLTVRGRF